MRWQPTMYKKLGIGQAYRYILTCTYAFIHKVPVY